MIVNESLYTYGYREKKRKKVIKKLVRGDKVKNLYVVVLPVLGDGILEIYPYNQLLHPFYKSYDKDITVVGIADGKDCAVSLIEDMIQDIMTRIVFMMSANFLKCR